MKLKNLQKHWDAFGRINPMGAILTETTWRPHGTASGTPKLSFKPGSRKSTMS